MKILGKLILTSMALFSMGTVMAGDAVVNDARLWAAPDNTRVVFDISAPVQHTLFMLSNPDRLVIDISDAKLQKKLAGSEYSKGLVKGIRTATHNQKDLRIVLDLNRGVKPKSFLLKPHQSYGNRLVIDLIDREANAQKPVKSIASQSQDSARDLIIAIDAGHGGEDPGATGYRGTREKDVVMQIAKRLKVLIEQERGMTPVMIRDGDYYVGLRKRVEIAREHKADMFISIHADAFHDKRAKGASVYTLSQHGASTETARWLADSENASDYIGGVSLDDKDDLLASVLLDLSMNGTIEASLELGDYVLSELKSVSRTHKSRVEQAGFAVLKSPDIPSILVETAFISNPQEEQNLRNSAHQEKMARSILKGLRNYFAHNAVPGTMLAQQRSQRRHVISRGDTLSEIAHQYSVSLNAIKDLNDIKGDTLRVGEVLVLPGS